MKNLKKFEEYSYTQVSSFEEGLKKIEPVKGYSIIEDGGPEGTDTQIFHFDTKEEFDANFTQKKHPYYPGSMLIPIHITSTYGDSVDCLIDGDEYYLDLNNLYLAIDGKLVSYW